MLKPQRLPHQPSLQQQRLQHQPQPRQQNLQLHLLPHDRTTGGSRGAWDIFTDGRLGAGLRYRVQAQRVSDDDYWKDFPHLVPSTSPRLLAQDVNVERELRTAAGLLTGYARLQHWQVLQSNAVEDLIVSPYQRSPQLGLRLAPEMPGGLRAAIETEVNRFTRPDGSASTALPTGWRAHALGNVSRPFTWPGAWVTPKLTLNGASYQTDQVGGSVRRSRLIPTASLDATRWDMGAEWRDSGAALLRPDTGEVRARRGE